MKTMPNQSDCSYKCFSQIFTIIWRFIFIVVVVYDDWPTKICFVFSCRQDKIYIHLIAGIKHRTFSRTHARTHERVLIQLNSWSLWLHSNCRRSQFSYLNEQCVYCFKYIYTFIRCLVNVEMSVFPQQWVVYI